MSIFDTVEGKNSPPPDNRDLVAMIGQTLISRRDVKAIEGKNGAWRPATDTGKRDGKRLPFTMADFDAHLAGTMTLGHYVVGTNDTTKFFLLDLDFDKEGFYVDTTEGPDGNADHFLSGAVKCNPREVWQDPSHPGHAWLKLEMQALTEGLARLVNRTLGIGVAILDSGGKGYHVYGLCGQRSAQAARDLAIGAMNSLDTFELTQGQNFFKHKTAYRNITIEVFPKQGSLEGKDLGNLVRLPLGVNQKTGRRSHFVSVKGDRWVEMDPMRALDGDLPWE